MGKGQEYLQRVNKALGAFEDAVARRENKKLLESKIPLQQEVDRARDEVIGVVVSIVTETRMSAGQ